jgi:hypothetical protein
LFGHAAVVGIRAFTDVAVPADVFAPVGHLLALVGLVGLSPVVDDYSPPVARAGAVVAAVVALGWAVVTLSMVAAALGSRPSELEPLFGALSVLVLVSTTLPYALFGVVTLRSGVAPPRVGVLLLSPAVLLVVLLGGVVVLGASPLAGVIVAVGLALSMVAIGYTLRTESARTDRSSLDGGATHG